MFETIMSTIVHLVITLLIVKLYTDVVLRKVKQPDNKLTWKDASVVIERLEARISQLQERDALAQEKIWNLEDQNRVLKLHMLELRRALAAQTPPTQPFTSKGMGDSQDDEEAE